MKRFSIIARQHNYPRDAVITQVDSNPQAIVEGLHKMRLQTREYVALPFSEEWAWVKAHKYTNIRIVDHDEGNTTTGADNDF